MNRSSSTWNPEAITFDTMRLGSQDKPLLFQEEMEKRISMPFDFILY